MNNIGFGLQGKGLHYYFVNTSDVAMSAVIQNADGSDAVNHPTIHNTPAAFCNGVCHIEVSLIPFETAGSVTLMIDNSLVITGGIDGLSGMSTGILGKMLKTHAVISDTYNLSYGFYYARESLFETGLSKQDQFYAYVTPPQQNWMRKLATQNPAVYSAPFSTFVLPGAHDSGTFDLTAVNKLLNDVESASFILMLSSVYGSALPDVLADVALSVITGEAVTQKDNITTMLNLGCRYFDFRPGMMPSPLNTVLPDIYHIHAVIPGYPFSSFLQDILNWLNNNSSEIVVVNLQTAGFASDINVPAVEQLQAVLDAAQIRTGTESLRIGGVADMEKSYEELLTSNTRLFILSTSSAFYDWNKAKKYDSYSDSYNTTDPAAIISALGAMTGSGPAGSNYTVLQLQGTATGQSEVGIAASLIFSGSDAYEPLISTKALFDSNTYPWLLNNVQKNLDSGQLLILLNDFFDNGLTDVAFSLTDGRVSAGFNRPVDLP